VTWRSIEEILKKLTHETDPTLFVLYGGDIITIKCIFKEIVTIYSRDSQQRKYVEVKRFFEV